MKTALKIIVCSIILVGSTLFFAHWSINSLETELSRIDKIQETNLANIIAIQKTKQVEAESPVTELSTTTTPELQTTAINVDDFKFTFPATYIDVYKECTYTVSWDDIGIESIDIALIDAGTKEKMGPISSGIPKNIIGQNIKNFEWKVGNVWPGEYYIFVSKINNSEVQKKSALINIGGLSSDLDVNGRQAFCSEHAISLKPTEI